MEENKSGIFDIAIIDNKLDLMSETIITLSKKRNLAFVVAHTISLFIDGLVTAPRNDKGVAYKAYLKTNFPELCKAIGADLFYLNLRNKAAHEFAVKPPLALAHSDSYKDKTTYTEWREIKNQQWLCLNVDRLSEDFLNHIDTIKKNNSSTLPKITKEKIILNEDYLNENKIQLLNDAELNYFYGKDVFFSAGFNHNKSILFQMLGNLGAYPNDHEYDNSSNIVILSDSLFDQAKNGFKNEILKKVEKKLNSKGKSKKKPIPIFYKKPINDKNPLVITESSLLDFVKRRTSYYNDKATQALINSLQES